MGDRDPPSLTQPSPVSVAEAAVFETPTLRRTKPAVHAAPLPAALSTRQPPAPVAVGAEEPVAHGDDADGTSAAASRPAEMLLQTASTEAAAAGAAKLPKKVVSIKSAPTHVVPSVPFPDQDAEYETSESEDAEDYKKGKWVMSWTCAPCCAVLQPPFDVAWACKDCLLSSAVSCCAVL